jgi:hypothetical protein
MLLETLPAVDGTPLNRLERGLCLLAAVVAGVLVYLLGPPIVASPPVYITHNFPLSHPLSAYPKEKA